MTPMALVPHIAFKRVLCPCPNLEVELEIE